MRLTRAEIDIQALRFNLNGIRKKVGASVKVMGLVKANAYGHGAETISNALADFGIDYLGAGFLEEGIALRDQGIKTPILVLGGVLGKQIRQFLDYDLEITLSSIELAERIEQEIQLNGGKKARVHLKIDTGMERIGVRPENAVQFIEKVSRMRHIDVVGIYSHFATADDKDKSFAVQQLSRFETVLESIRTLGIDIPIKHIANSGAVLDMPDSYYSMVRPGIMMYGIYPSNETSESIPLKPVLSLKSEIVFIKEVPPNTSISYGRKYFTSAKTRIATVPVGYGDGYSRRFSNKANVLIKGKLFPVVGIICMDQLMVDIGTGTDIHVGNDVTLIGSEGNTSISAWQIADTLETNPYEVLTGIASRVPRMVYNN